MNIGIGTLLVILILVILFACAQATRPTDSRASEMSE
jgi:hypothetical protein